MDWAELLGNEDIRRVAEDYRQRAQRSDGAKDLTFNLLEILGDTHLHECCHSKIMAALLRRRIAGRMQFAMLFVDYLNKVVPTGHAKIDVADFIDCKVTDETKRIDICLWGKTSAIIVENKINDAEDRVRQLPTYVEAVDKEGLATAMVVYLTVDGAKEGPSRVGGWKEGDHERLANLLVCIGAYTNTNLHDDLVSGWLEPCLTLAESAPDRSACVLIEHYIQFLQRMGRSAMTRPAVSEFLGVLLRNSGAYQSAMTVRAICDELPVEIGRKLQQRVGTNIDPFKQVIVGSGNSDAAAIWDQWKFENNDGRSHHLGIFVRLKHDGLLVQICDQDSGDVNLVKGLVERCHISTDFSHQIADGYECSLPFNGAVIDEAARVVKSAIAALRPLANEISTKCP